MSYHTPRPVVLVPFTAILIILVLTLLCDIVNKPFLLPVNYTAHKSVSLNYYCWYLCGMMNVTWEKRVLNKSSKQVSSVFLGISCDFLNFCIPFVFKFYNVFELYNDKKITTYIILNIAIQMK